mgnify:CR=1
IRAIISDVLGAINTGISWERFLISSNSLEFKNHMIKMLKVLKKNFSRNSKLIEVGCGKGEFLSIVKKEKYFKYQGYDAVYQGKDKNIFKRYLTENDRIQAD